MKAVSAADRILCPSSIADIPLRTYLAVPQKGSSQMILQEGFWDLKAYKDRRQGREKRE